MVHLLPLPGPPRYAGSMSDVVERAVADAAALAESGSLMIENYGDVPFFPNDVPAETAAAMAVASRAVADGTGLPFGVNVLRNDVLSALGVAAATGGAFVRVNVLSGMMYTDQGPLIGKAADALRKRSTLAPDVEIWADVMVKHAAAPPGIDARQAAADTVERGLADAVIVSGSGTGIEPDLHEAAIVRAAIPPETRLVVGSGADVDNLPKLADLADSIIVGSSLKVGGDARNPVDPDRADRFVKTAKDHGLL